VDEVVGGIASTTRLAACIFHSYLDRSCSSEQNAIAAGYHLTGYLTIDRHLAGLDALHRDMPDSPELAISCWQSNLLHIISQLARTWINDAPTRLTRRYNRYQAQRTASSMHMIRNISSRRVTLVSSRLSDRIPAAAHNSANTLMVPDSICVRCLDLEQDTSLADSDSIQSHRTRSRMAAKRKSISITKESHKRRMTT
jgi:hypothetical protein